MNKWIFFALFILLGCHSRENTNSELFKIILKESLFEVQTISFPHKDFFNSATVKDPVGTWVPAFMIDEAFCLYYRTPLGDRLGELRLTSTIEKKCEGAYEQEVIARLEAVDELKFRWLPKRERDFEKEQEWVISGRAHGELFEIKIFSPYLTLSEKKTEAPSKLSSSEKDKLYRPSKDENFIGLYKHTYSEGDVHFCQKFDSECNEVQAYTCDECRYGWYEVVSSNCEGKTTKLCGPQRCGRRGEPACPRGTLHLTEELEDELCVDKSKAGFCLSGLETTCDENGVLICL